MPSAPGAGAAPLDHEVLDTLVTAQTPFDALPQAMAPLASPDHVVLRHRVVYG